MRKAAALLIALTFTVGSAHSQTASKCVFSINAIERPGAGGFGVYVEGVAMDCRDKEEAYRAITAGIEAMKRKLRTEADPLKSQCYKVPSMEPIDCDPATAIKPVLNSPR